MTTLPALADEIGVMLAELESHRLEVVLVPTRRFVNHGGCVRVAIGKNADWYRAFCAAYPSARVRRNTAPDTRIRRRDTVRVLSGILAGNTRSGYAAHLLAIARARLQRPSAMDARIAALRRTL